MKRASWGIAAMLVATLTLTACAEHPVMEEENPSSIPDSVTEVQIEQPISIQSEKSK